VGISFGRKYLHPIYPYFILKKRIEYSQELFERQSYNFGKMSPRERAKRDKRMMGFRISIMKNE